ncbi:hypothetical protein [Sporisorium scitamineum]|uniref:Uncharacterized protein n=1 Tax=Sporisorium scitamineum TaxID=49012 RepID=A0A0F7RZJ5_9BASI|nr:hypothetical protein [Sporisorium scitamineum]
MARISSVLIMGVMLAMTGALVAHPAHAKPVAQDPITVEEAPLVKHEMADKPVLEKRLLGAAADASVGGLANAHVGVGVDGYPYGYPYGGYPYDGYGYPGYGWPYHHHKWWPHAGVGVGYSPSSPSFPGLWQQ